MNNDITILSILAKVIAEKADAYEQVEKDIVLLNNQLRFHQGDPLEIYKNLQQKYAELNTFHFEFQTHLNSLLKYAEENKCASNLQ